MKNLAVFGLAVLIFGISGCTSMKMNYRPEITSHDFPALNTETTVYLGEEMLIQGTQLTGKSIYVRQPVDGVCYDINSGKYRLVGMDDKNYYLSHEDSVSIAALCDPIQGLYVPRNDQNKVCVITIFGASSCYNADTEMQTYNIISPDHIQRTLIFSGKTGNKVEFMYAERSGLQTMMTHNVSYDISQNPIIGYRGARIQIISCTNESITYIVLNNFPDR